MKEIEDKLMQFLEELSCETGTIHRVEGTFLHLVVSVGVPEFLMDKIATIPIGKGIAGAAAETKKPVELCNLQQDLGGVAKIDARKTGVSGSVAIPILSNDQEVLGTVGVGKQIPYEFTDEEKKRLSEFGLEILPYLEV